MCVSQILTKSQLLFVCGWLILRHNFLKQFATLQWQQCVKVTRLYSSKQKIYSEEDLKNLNYQEANTQAAQVVHVKFFVRFFFCNKINMQRIFDSLETFREYYIIKEKYILFIKH